MSRRSGVTRVREELRLAFAVRRLLPFAVSEVAYDEPVRVSGGHPYVNATPTSWTKPEPEPKPRDLCASPDHVFVNNKCVRCTAILPVVQHVQWCAPGGHHFEPDQPCPRCGLSVEQALRYQLPAAMCPSGEHRPYAGRCLNCLHDLTYIARYQWGETR